MSYKRTTRVLLVVLVANASIAYAEDCWVDNVDNCVWDQVINDSMNGLSTVWPQVNLTGGLWTITLVNSDFGRSPDEFNRHVGIFMPYNNDQPGIDGPRYFTLNGVGDSVTFIVSSTASRGRAWLGFHDLDPADNHGTSTVEFACESYSITMTVDGRANCSAIDYPGVFLPLANLQQGSYSIELVNTTDIMQCYVICDGIAPEFSDYWMFSLHEIADQDGVLDEMTVEMLEGATLYLGKIDNWVADNWGGTTVSVEHAMVVVEAVSWSGVKALFR